MTTKKGKSDRKLPCPRGGARHARPCLQHAHDSGTRVAVAWHSMNASACSAASRSLPRYNKVYVTRASISMSSASKMDTVPRIAGWRCGCPVPGLGVEGAAGKVAVMMLPWVTGTARGYLNLSSVR